MESADSDLTEYDEKMIEKYQNDVENNELQINNNEDLRTLNFISQLNVSKLKLSNCYNIEPQLQSDQIRELTIEECGISSVEGFQLENIKVLNLPGNEVCELNGDDFPHIRELDISNNDCDDISFLESMPKLKKLNMNMNRIDDMSVLEQLLSLEDLDISETKQGDIDSLKNLSKLKRLKLFWNDVVNIDVLGKLKNLEDVDVSYNAGVDISPLMKLQKLAKLNVSCINLTNFETLLKIHSLKELNLSRNEIKQLDLQQCTQLTSLTLAENQLIDVSFIKFLVNLKHLDLSHNKADVEPLSTLIQLTSLNLKDCNLCTLSTLKYLVNLEELNISDNQIDITAICCFTKLKILQLNSCNIRNLSVLKNLNLEELGLDENELENIKDLQYMIGMKKLSLNGCGLYEISIIRLLQKIKYLCLANNKIISLSPLAEIKTLSDLDIDSNFVQDLSKIQTHKNYKSYNIGTQQEPTAESMKLAIRMDAIDQINIQARQIRRKIHNLKAVNNIKKESINMSKSMFNQVNFANNVIRLFQKLDNNEGCQ
ncbi:leucine-rich_repeat domain-containing protein [Hexamita inflata]|uniref:Leucine-rich repeat domain-containing protein n=2 Tax=Hexamita inflata TaxID=28002 RepID=A0AA86UJ76_9EUKA|nr:leucine-rich repeat domain-containing protein [Hexamita inflata]